MASNIVFRPVLATCRVGLFRSATAVPTRKIASQAIPTSEASRILEEQRKRRPTSPHLSIYQLQLTSCLSSSHRITGIIASGGLYLFASAYLVSPIFGWNLDTASLVAAFGALPGWEKVSLKMLAALPVTFHSFNGMRHLLWDTGRGLSLKGVYATGYTVLGLTAVSSLALALFF